MKKNINFALAIILIHHTIHCSTGTEIPNEQQITNKNANPSQGRLCIILIGGCSPNTKVPSFTGGMLECYSNGGAAAIF